MGYTNKYKNFFADMFLIQLFNKLCLKIMSKNVFEGPIFQKFSQGKKVPLPTHPI